jgi:hypothetical protein
MLPAVDLVRVGISVLVALLLCTLRLRLVLWIDTIYSIVIGGLTVFYVKDVFSLVSLFYSCNVDCICRRSKSIAECVLAAIFILEISDYYDEV